MCVLGPSWQSWMTDWFKSVLDFFFESSSLCSGIVEHLTLLTSVPGQIELVNTETPRQVGHACLKKKRGCLGVIFPWYSSDFLLQGGMWLQLQGNLARMAQQPLWVFHVSDRKHAAKTPWNSWRLHGRPDRRFTAAPIRQTWRDLWHGDPRKPILFSGRLVLSETVSWKTHTHREFRCITRRWPVPRQQNWRVQWRPGAWRSKKD